jgi:hypothetical protein
MEFFKSFIEKMNQPTNVVFGQGGRFIKSENCNINKIQKTTKKENKQSKLKRQEVFFINGRFYKTNRFD